MSRIYHHCLAAACIMMLGGCGMIDYAYKKAPAYVASEFEEAFEPARQSYWQAYAAVLEDNNSWLTKA
jgi:hypothetical protein